MNPTDQSHTDDPLTDDPSMKPAVRVGAQMGFLDHLEELRWTLIKCAIAFIVMVVLVAFFLRDFTGFLNWPIDRAKVHFPETAFGTGLVTTSPLGVFTVLIQVCFLGGLTLALPFCLLFVGQFVAPALTQREMKLLLPACLAAFFLFLFGAAFSYFFIVPSAIRFSFLFNEMLGFQLVWSADRYYGLLVWMVLGLGVTFQFPLIIMILVYLGIIDTPKLRKGRRIMIVVFFVVAASLTTPDPITQVMVAVPMWALYELSIIVARRIERFKAERDRAFYED